MNSIFLAIDLKSFFASVECVERGLDPLNTNLLVADPTRSDSTICLAVSPSLKAVGVPGRPRLFEAKQAVQQENLRRKRAAGKKFEGKSVFATELRENHKLELDYITAPPRMSLYIEYSTRVYETYLHFVSKDDVHVYSVDEVFIDLTPYLKFYNMTAHEIAMNMIHAVLIETGITATAGIGSNLYLAKIAMDIEAKHKPADKDGVRIAELNEQTYREKLWTHEPITDFWRIGSGYANRLKKMFCTTMGDVARLSIKDPERIYKEFGINGELLIDHAWGFESCTMKDIKAYKPNSTSHSSGQVLPAPYTWKKARLIIREMTENYAFELMAKGIVVKQIGLWIGYDRKTFDPSNPAFEKINRLIDCGGAAFCSDGFGRFMPVPVHGAINLEDYTNSITVLSAATDRLFTALVNPYYLVRRISLVSGVVMSEIDAANEKIPELDLFDDRKTRLFLEKEQKIQRSVYDIKQRFGKNAMLKGMNFQEGAMQKERNAQIGGHKA